MPEHTPWKRKKMTSDLIIFNDMGRIVASFERSIELDFALLSANFHDWLVEALSEMVRDCEYHNGRVDRSTLCKAKTLLDKIEKEASK
jgi:hypothetical protein